jgi:hypothetical protein
MRGSSWLSTGQRSMPVRALLHRCKDPRRRLAGMGGTCVAAHEPAHARLSGTVGNTALWALAARDAAPEQALPAPPTADSRAVVAGLLAHADALAASAGGAVVRFTPDETANALTRNDPFAFLIAVICDQGSSPSESGLFPMSCGGVSATSILTAWPPSRRRSLRLCQRAELASFRQSGGRMGRAHCRCCR